MAKKKIKVAKKTLNLFKRLAAVVAPPKDLKVSEWADEYRYLSPEASAEPGKWRTDRAPYQREILNSVNDPMTEATVVKSSAQVGKTEIILNIVGYFIDHDPSPILLLQPTVDNAKDFSKDRVATMIRDTPTIGKCVKNPKSKDSGNTILHKTFLGGHLSMVGANSPAGLASRPIRILLCDEVDRYPASAGSEGDPVALAEKRTKTFWNRKKVYVSTPTDDGVSRIQKEYEDSTQEEWCLPCPCCGKLQPLTWAQIDFDTVSMRCKFCDELSREHEWKSGTGIWVAQNPERIGKRGFHLNALASPWERWEKIIDEFKTAKKQGKQSLKTWVNTYLGEVWTDDEGDAVDYELLMRRRETYNCQVPEGVLILTAGVDVQDDRLECEVVGWGLGKESWGIEYKVFAGLPSQKQVWEELEVFLDSSFYFEDGNYLRIMGTCVDTGGHCTTETYEFLKPRELKRFYGIKGYGGSGKPLIGKPSRNNVKKAILFPLGVDAGKERIYSNLALTDEGQGFCHFPLEAEKGYSKEYLKSLCSEKKVIRYQKGVASYSWVKKFTRNEGLDLRNYAQAALEILDPKLEELKRLKDNGISMNRAPGMRRPAKKKSRVFSKGV